MGSLDTNEKDLEYLRHVIAKTWGIVKPNEESEYDTNNFFDYVREAVEAKTTLDLIDKNNLCVVPPNQETSEWTVYAEFDGEFGFDKEIGSGKTLRDALEMAAAVVEDTEDVT